MAFTHLDSLEVIMLMYTQDLDEPSNQHPVYPTAQTWFSISFLNNITWSLADVASASACAHFMQAFVIICLHVKEHNTRWGYGLHLNMLKTLEKQISGTWDSIAFPEGM